MCTHPMLISVCIYFASILTFLCLYTLNRIFIYLCMSTHSFTELYPDAVAKHCSAVCQSLALTLIQSTAHMSPALKKAYLDGLGQLAQVCIYLYSV